jgi:uncharacterized protein (TIGR03067 family)
MLFLPLTGLLLAGGTPEKDAVKADLAKLQGEWEMISLEQAGLDAPEGTVKAYRRKIEGNKYTVTIKKGEETITLKGSFTLDPTKKPKTIDVEYVDEGGKKYTLHGIYELKDDTQKLCVGPSDEKRPTEFTSEEGSKRNVIVWKRIKK